LLTSNNTLQAVRYQRQGIIQRPPKLASFPINVSQGEIQSRCMPEDLSFETLFRRGSNPWICRPKNSPSSAESSVEILKTCFA
jgi:hypothetical protein